MSNYIYFFQDPNRYDNGKKKDFYISNPFISLKIAKENVSDVAEKLNYDKKNVQMIKLHMPIEKYQKLKDEAGTYCSKGYKEWILEKNEKYKPRPSLLSRYTAEIWDNRTKEHRDSRTLEKRRTNRTQPELKEKDTAGYLHNKL